MKADNYDTEKLKRLRGGKSLRDVAEEMGGIDHKKIARAENGKNCTYEFLCELAEHYKVPVGELLYAVRDAA